MHEAERSDILWLEKRLDDQRDYFTKTITDLEARTAQAHEASLRANDKADVAMERRLDLLNEFRSTLEDRDRGFIPRLEYSARHDALVLVTTRTTERVSTLEGRITGYGSVAIVTALLTSIALHFIH